MYKLLISLSPQKIRRRGSGPVETYIRTYVAAGTAARDHVATWAGQDRTDARACIAARVETVTSNRSGFRRAVGKRRAELGERGGVGEMHVCLLTYAATT